jgi:hypothetical protein
MDQRAYLVLFFAIAFFAVLAVWGIYTRSAIPLPSPPTSATTQTLVERLRGERERRINERAATTTTTAAAPAVE